MIFLKVVLACIALPLFAQQKAPVKLIPKTIPAKPQPRSSVLKPMQIPQVPPVSGKSKEPFNLKKVIAERKAMAKSQGLSATKLDYYNLENLQQLKSQGIPYHLPCEIIIDQNNEENPKSKTTAMTIRFASSLLAQSHMIICSAGIAHNLFYRLKFPSGAFADELRSYQFDMSQWNVYDVLNSQFLLFVPVKSKSYFDQELRVKDANKLLEVTDRTIHIKERDLSWLVNKKNNLSPKFSIQNLSNIFISKQMISDRVAPIWDFGITGHGSYDLKQIIGLNHSDVNDLLSFLDKYLNTGIVALESCFSGGKNLALLQVSQTGIKLSHSYILIVCSSTDEVTFGLFFLSDLIKFYNQFFTNAAQMADKGESLNKIIKDLEYISFATFSPHGETSRIPQVWFPNGSGFQTLNITNDILSLGKVFIRTHRDEKSPIIVQGKRVVLIYSNAIQFPLIIEPTQFKQSSEYLTASLVKDLEEIKKFKWKNSAMPTEKSFWEPLPADTLAQIAKKLEKDIPGDLAVSLSSNTITDQLVFPQFLLMGGIDTIKFKEIRVQNPPNCSACGVLRFIRDAFFDIKENPTTKYIKIDSLTGYNDIALILKARHLKYEAIGLELPVIEDLLKNFNQTITLKNVSIMVTDQFLHANFELYDKQWRFELAYVGWDIVPGDPSKDIKIDLSAAIMSGEGINQKSISDVLKQEQQEILKKKTTP